MNARRTFTVASLALTCLVLLTTRAPAQSLDERVTVTFSAPVGLPGRVLPAGTYVFSDLEPNHLTRVLSSDGKTIGIFFAIPEERRDPVDKATIVLDETTAGSPQRIQAWFYPGNSTGSEFLYRGTSSHHRLASALDKAGRSTEVAVADTAKATVASTEFAGKRAERVVVNSGAAIAHAARYLVS